MFVFFLTNLVKQGETSKKTSVFTQPLGPTQKLDPWKLSGSNTFRKYLWA